jgi:hypothetical protein
MSTGRAKGKHLPRMGEGSENLPDLADSVEPGSALGHKLGVSKRTMGAPSPIPGGEEHIVSPQSFRNRVPAPNANEIPDTPDQNAHGVPPGSHHGFTRAQLMRGKAAGRDADLFYADTRTPVRPIPVFVVESDDKQPVYRTASPRNLVAPVTGTDTASLPRLCGRNPERRYVLLLNESTNSDARIAQRPSDLLGGGGALLTYASNSYLKIETQDELYAVSVTGTAATISIIEVFEQKGSGR